MDSDQQGSGSLLSPTRRDCMVTPLPCVRAAAPGDSGNTGLAAAVLGAAELPQVGSLCPLQGDLARQALPVEGLSCPSLASGTTRFVQNWDGSHLRTRTGKCILNPGIHDPNEQCHTCSQSFPQETVLTWSRTGSLTSLRPRRPGLCDRSPGHRALPVGGSGARSREWHCLLAAREPREPSPGEGTAVWAACSWGAAGVWPSAGPTWATLGLCHPRGAGSPRALPMLWPPAIFT